MSQPCFKVLTLERGIAIQPPVWHKERMKIRNISLNPRSVPWLTAILLAVSLAASAQDWRPAPGPLMTRWAKEVSPTNALPEYPRPQMARRDWLNLNGLWDYAIRPKAEAMPANFDGKILVPFPVESALSGVMKKVGATSQLWYRRTFERPTDGRGQRLLLHFGAVDWEATVYLNGKELGAHRGGYDGFSIDLTDALKPSGPQELAVAVWDPSDAGAQPRGKQVERPNGIWYTSVSGIWQTVWLEPVPESRVDSLKITPDVDGGKVTVEAVVSGPVGDTRLQMVVMDQSNTVNRIDRTLTPATGVGSVTQAVTILIPKAKLWSPDSPFLYDLKVTLLRQGKAVDEVASYFGMRKISVAKDEQGTPRLFLNNQPLFQFGPLDQGWWPDGLYTAPTDAALRYDIEVEKQLGFNMARKHVKVEPDRWYYWCDKLGLLVWQDMPSAFPAARQAVSMSDTNAQFDLELKRMIDGRWNHPSIVMWVPFNEGWGQHDTARVVDWIQQYDPRRLVNNASGWTDQQVGDVHDIHVYPGPRAPGIESKRAGVLGEFGGLGLPLPGHTWQDQANWGYRSFTTREALADAYVDLITKLHPLAGSPGLCAAIYTQTSDVEIEVNGLMTYDREIIKMDAARISAANRLLYTTPPPVPIVKTLTPASRDQGVEWHFTTQSPPEGWNAPGFNESAWPAGNGGFGTRGTPGAVVRTEWSTPDIWLRRSFELSADFKASHPQCLLHHDEDAEVYINGTLALKVTGYIADYDLFEISPEARGSLKPGPNLLAVHCHQTTGGQYIDVGLVDVVEATK